MNIFKSKLFWFAPVVLLLLMVIFSVAFYPAFNPKPKDLKIAIVNHDKGTKIQDKKVDIGKNLEDKLKDSDSDKVKWVSVDSEKDARKGLENQKYYGVAVLEKNFSKHAMSKTQKVAMDSKKQEMQDKVKSGEIPPAQAKQMQQKMSKSGGAQNINVKKAHIKTFVNGGGNLQTTQMASQILEKIGTNVNNQITKQGLSTLDKQHVKVDAKDIHALTNPVKVDSHKTNKVKDHQANGNAPFLMFMPVWMGSIITSVLLFYAFRTANNVGVTQRLIAAGAQIVAAIVTAFIGGFGYVYFMSGVLGFDFNDINKMAVFVSLAILGFISLILGTMSWIGMVSIPIFILLMFFSMQMVMLPKQMLPKFYQDYIVDWNPFVHYANNLREILYMGHSIEMNSTMWMFIGFMLFGIISVLLASVVKKHKGKRSEIPS